MQIWHWKMLTEFVKLSWIVKNKFFNYRINDIFLKGANMSIRSKSKYFCRKIKNSFKIASDKNNSINIDTKIMGNVKIKLGGK